MLPARPPTQSALKGVQPSSPSGVQIWAIVAWLNIRAPLTLDQATAPRRWFTPTHSVVASVMHMMEDNLRPLVAVINTSDEVVNLLTTFLEMEGYRSASAFVSDFREGRADLSAFIQQYSPRAIIWDIAIPYEENWSFFRSCIEKGLIDLRTVVVTTTNKRVLDELVGPNPAHELIGKPYDLDELADALRRALAGQADQ